MRLFPMGLLVQVDGPVGTYIMNRWFDDLAGLEAYRANRPSETRDFMARRDALLAAPASIAILEAVVPNA